MSRIWPLEVCQSTPLVLLRSFRSLHLIDDPAPIPIALCTADGADRREMAWPGPCCCCAAFFLPSFVAGNGSNRVTRVRLLRLFLSPVVSTLFLPDIKCLAPLDSRRPHEPTWNRPGFRFRSSNRPDVTISWGCGAFSTRRSLVPRCLILNPSTYLVGKPSVIASQGDHPSITFEIAASMADPPNELDQATQSRLDVA